MPLDYVALTYNTFFDSGEVVKVVWFKNLSPEIFYDSYANSYYINGEEFPRGAQLRLPFPEEYFETT